MLFTVCSTTRVVLLLLTSFMNTSAEVANFNLIKKKLHHGWFAGSMGMWQGYDFFETIHTTSTTLHSIAKLIEDIQVAFILTHLKTCGISWEERRAGFQKFGQFTDFMQFILAYQNLQSCISLNIFIDSTKEDFFRLARMTNDLYNDSLRLPIILHLENISGDKMGKVCTKA